MRIGVDIGGSSVKIGAVDGDGHVLSRVSVPMDPGAGYRAMALAITRGAAEAAKAAGASLNSAVFVGAGAPGCVDSREGTLIFAGNLRWRDVPLQYALQERIPAPVRIGNDADCALLAESLFGAASCVSSALLITLGTGVGGALYFGGRLFTGGDGKGCEIGHMQLVSDGELCSCGLRGCFEAYASMTALTRQTQAVVDAAPDSAMHGFLRDGRATGRTAFDAAAAGDEAAKAVVDRYARYVAAGIGSLINVFRPELVLIGGGISARGEALLGPIRENLPDFVFSADSLGIPPVRAAALQNDAGLIGAAFLDKA